MILQAYSDGNDIIWVDSSAKVWNFHPFEDIGMGNLTFRLGRPDNIKFGRPQTSIIRPALLQQAKAQVKAKNEGNPVIPIRRIAFGLPNDIAIRARGSNAVKRSNELHLTTHKASLIDPNKEQGVFLPSKITLPQKQKEKSKIGKFFDRIKQGDVDITKIAGDVRSIVKELKPKQKINPKVLNPQQGRPTPGPNQNLNVIRKDGSNNSSDEDSNSKKLLIGGGILLVLALGAYAVTSQNDKKK